MGELAVAYHATSAALVRRSLAAELAALRVPADQIDDVVLVASELVGNALRHAAPHTDDQLDVTWDVEPDAIVVRVLDGTREPLQHQPLTLDATSGRGLNIVAALARDWGVQLGERGKQVWARVPLSRAVPA
jgi:serine/threonine-protein kinase RsbW